MNVYLAGGMRSGWQKKVKDAVAHHNYFDPRVKEMKKKPTLEEYGTWDLHYIKMCDLVFAYMERTNPSGVGMACELGFAYGIGKTVILVLENANGFQNDRYLQFMKKVSNITFDNFDEGLAFLSSFHPHYHFLNKGK